MAEYFNDLDWQEAMARLERSRSTAGRDEGSRVAAAGAAVPTWVVKVLSVAEYNLYNVRQVVLNAAGVNPSALLGSETQAFNLAEPFMATGAVSAGAYGLMWRVGDKNVMYVQP